LRDNNDQSPNNRSEKKATRRASQASARMNKKSQKISIRCKAMTSTSLINTSKRWEI